MSIRRLAAVSCLKCPPRCLANVTSTPEIRHAGATELRGSSDRQQPSNFVKQYPNSPLATELQERLAALERAEKLRLEEAARPGGACAGRRG
jgi:hypothetical protein